MCNNGSVLLLYDDKIMKQALYFIVLCTTLVVVSCGSGGQRVKHIENLGDTPYQEDTILVTLGTNSERAQVLLDSAVRLGNINEYREKFIRASIFTKSLAVQRQDSALVILEALLQHDSVRYVPENHESVLNLLINVSRAKTDYNMYMRWAMEKAELCREQGEEVEQLRTEAEVGMVMTHLGQIDEGLAKLDESILQLDRPGSIDRMDAFIVAVKRKINSLNDLGRYAEVIPLAQRILDRLDHYEQHADDYAEDSYRLSWSDNPSDRDHYIDFSRAQANGFLAIAYALTGDKTKASECLARFGQTDYSKTLSARRMIIPAQMALGMYDEAMATSNEIVRRMGTDTINDDYATILRHHATVARAKGHSAEAFDLMSRHAALAKVLSDSLHASEAHDYAARYHDQEQKLEIQEKDAALSRMSIYIAAAVIIALLILAFALYAIRKNRIISQKNHALVRMINESMGSGNSATRQEPDQSEVFATIDAAIRDERLYANNNLQRQDICDRFGISRHTLNDLLAEHADGSSFPQYINGIRLKEALRLFQDTPDMTLSDVAKAIGFTPSNFREQFKQKYGMTPQEYRQNM